MSLAKVGGWVEKMMVNFLCLVLSNDLERERDTNNTCGILYYTMS